MQNALLARLSHAEFTRIESLCKIVPLKFKQVLIEAHASMRHVYFPRSGVLSAITVMQSGTSIEVATIGNEGMVGLLACFGIGESPHRQLVQIPGEAYRMEIAAFRDEISHDGEFRDLMNRYNTAFHYQVSQAIACNGLHVVQKRCCRWILMCHDRAGADEFPMTHEFLSHMLGVRRVSVTEVLKPLHDAGLVKTRRGHITVLDRKGLEKASCECYRSIRNEFERLLGRPNSSIAE